MEPTCTFPLVGLNPSSGSSLVTRTATQWPFGLVDSAWSKSNGVAATEVFRQASYPPPCSTP